jgi:hypothetical protein
MFQVPATVVGMVGSAFMVASFAPGAVGHSPNRETALSAPIAATQINDLKADRIFAPVVASNRHTVSVVELVGVSRVQVVLKDENGQVLFHSNPDINTTFVSKDTDLPVLTVKEGAGSNVKEQPVSRGASDEGATPKKRTQTHGCIGSVSPLAQAGREVLPSLCVTSLGGTIQTQG